MLTRHGHPHFRGNELELLLQNSLDHFEVLLDDVREVAAFDYEQRRLLLNKLLNFECESRCR